MMTNLPDYNKNPINLKDPIKVLAALRPVLDMGGYVFPCEINGKKPLVKWRDVSTNDPAKVRAWVAQFPGCNWGLDVGKSGLGAVDCDSKNGQKGPESFRAMAEPHGGYAGAWEALTPSGGRHVVFANSNGLDLRNSQAHNLMADGVETRGVGGYILIYPSVVAGRPYQWITGPEFAPVEVPEWLAREWQARQTGHSAPTTSNGNNGSHGHRRNREAWLQWALVRVKKGEGRNDTGFALANQLRDDNYTQGEAEEILGAYQAQVTGLKPEPYTMDEAVSSLGQAYSHPKRKPIGPIYEPGPVSLPLESVQKALDEEEAGDARLFAELFKGQIAHDHAEHTWYLYRAPYWVQDKTRAVLTLVTRDLASVWLSAAAEAQAQGDNKLADTFMSRAKLLRRLNRTKNVLELASALLALPEPWDNKPWRLACENGVIDLRTGELLDGRPDEYLRAHVPYQYKGLGAPAETWERALMEIFGGDGELVRFMQRLLGFGITGEPARNLPVLWGAGANGKTTVMETIKVVLGGELTYTLRAEVLIDAARFSGQGATPYVVALQGKRIVFASETKEGQSLDAGMVKLLTGRDTRTARGLYKEPVSYEPSDLIFLLTNHRPHLSGDDVALWDRLLLIPFEERFVSEPRTPKEGEPDPREHKADPALPEKLLAEAPGILSWLVRGCLDYQREGLNPPARVLKATEEYRKEENIIARFVDDNFEIEKEASVPSAQVWDRYQEWAKFQRVKGEMTRRKLIEGLRALGYEPGRTMNDRTIKGLRILANDSYKFGF